MLETMFRENKDIVFAVILLLILKMSSMLYLYVLTALRNKYIPHYYINRPSMFKYLEFLNVTDKNILLSVSKFVKVILYSYLILKKMNERITDS